MCLENIHEKQLDISAYPTSANFPLHAALCQNLLGIAIRRECEEQITFKLPKIVPGNQPVTRPKPPREIQGEQIFLVSFSVLSYRENVIIVYNIS